MTFHNVSDHATNFPSPQYQALSTPTRPNTQEFEFMTEEMTRSRSHSHALSVILGANGHVSTPASLVERRRSSSHQIQPSGTMTPTFHREQGLDQQDEKTETPRRLAIWKRQKKRWKRVIFWLMACFVFLGTFALTFIAPKQIQLLAPIVLGAGLSLLSTFMVLISFLRRHTVRRRPNELLAFVALSEFGLALLTVIHVLTMCSAATGTCQAMEFTSCSIATSLEIFFLLAGVGWFGANIFHLFVSISNPFANYKKQVILYHSIVWLLAVIASIVTPVVVFSTHMETKFQLSDTEMCRMVNLILPLLPSDAEKSTADKIHRLAQWQELNLAFWGLVIAIIVFIVVAGQLGLIVGWWRSNSGTIIALKARRRLMKRMAIYVHALNGMWLVVLVVFFIYRSNYSALTSIPVQGVPLRDNNGDLNVLNAFFHFVLTAKGYIMGVVWFNVNKPCCALALASCGIHKCQREEDERCIAHSVSISSHSASLTASQGASGGRSVNQTTMSMETGVQTTSVTSVAPGGTMCERRAQELPSLSQALDPRLSRSFSSSYEASTMESYEASQNNETLQREIIYYTVCGITKAIIRAAERARSMDDDENLIGANRSDNDDAGLVETTLFVGAERDSALVNNSFISHVQRVTILSSPRAYCEPRNQLPMTTLRRSMGNFQTVETRGRPRRSRPMTSSLLGYRPTCQVSHFQPTNSHSLANRPIVRPDVTFRSFNFGQSSLYPVSHVPFELFEQEIELQTTRSSLDASENRSTRATVLAGLRRTATSAFSQGRTAASVNREFVPDDPKPKVFVDYAPREFRAIRVAFGLSDEKYLASFRSTAKERVSAGSSGAFMFFSGDNSLLVKSLKEKECRALVEMAPAYAQYLSANPESRLIRFFGCHRVRLYGRNFYFAVMSNVLHNEHHTTTIMEKYDLKGSWVDRRARRPQRGDRVTCAECNATYTYGGSEETGYHSVVDSEDRDTLGQEEEGECAFHIHRPDIVLKDLDLKRSLHLSHDVATQLHAQIVADSDFLRELGIMDYSLLIGVHKCHFRTPLPSTPVPNPPEEGQSGVNLAPLGDKEVYFVGIIDILQQWDWEKQFEKAGKVLLGKSARGISAIAPTAYCRRFQARCNQILLGGTTTEEGDVDWELETKEGEMMKDGAHVV